MDQRAAFDDAAIRDAAIAAGPADLVVPVHACVPGRVRLRVAGLHRRPELRDRLERALRGFPAVHAAHANPATGTLLVQYDPASALQPIAARVAAALRGEVPSGPGDASPPWHALPVQEAAAALGCTPGTGLASAEIASRLAAAGANTLPRPPERSGLGMLLDQFASLPVALLAGAAVLSIATGGAAEAIAILGVVAANAAIGYAVESRTETTLRSLSEPAGRSSPVLRDGVAAELPPDQLVPGDVILLRRGSVIPADARIAAAENLTVSEAMLTGESLPVAKRAEPVLPEDAPLGARASMVYRGCVVTGGSGSAIVVATGSRTEMGRIQLMLGDAAAPATPMQRQLDGLGRQLVLLSVGVCAAVFGAGLLRGFGLLQMLRSAVSLAVAALPEGLPTVATTTLALGVEEMRRRDVLVRRLDAVETLGAVRVMCFDKTGTLTVNRMSVAAIAAGDPAAGSLRRDPVRGLLLDRDGRRADPAADPALRRLIEIGVLCSEVAIAAPDDAAGPRLDGTATETALVRLAEELGLDVPRLRAEAPRRALRQRSEAYRFMATTHDVAGKLLIAVKGSPLEVLALCGRWLAGGEVRDLAPADRAAIEQANLAMAGDGLRVLGFAFALRDADFHGEAAQPEDLVWAGLAGMADPVRPGVRALMAQLHRAGIHTVMMTGDQVPTARAVARQLGMNGASEIEVLDAMDMQGLAPRLLAEAGLRAHVFARVSPAQKLRIIRALQGAGAVVAMVGDGINDSPALKAADVGIAMGRESADAAREVADIVLQTDDLGALLTAVARGRGTYANVRRSVHYLLGSNLSEILIMLAATTAGFAQPLTVGQLLWINLVSDVLPALGLALEPPAPDVMEMPPRPPEEAIIRPADRPRLAAEGGIIAASSLLACGYGVLRHGMSPRASSITFATAVNSQLLHALRCRPGGGASPDGGRVAAAPNRMLSGALLAAGGLQLAAFLLPGLRGVLGVAPLGPLDIAVTLGAGALPSLIGAARGMGGDVPRGPENGAAA